MDIFDEHKKWTLSMDINNFHYLRSLTNVDPKCTYIMRMPHIWYITCAPSLPFVIGKYFFCASPSFLSRLFSAAAHPNCMRVSAQWYGRCNFTTSTPIPLSVHVRAIFLIKWTSSLMSFWYCPTRVFLSGSRNDAWTVKRRENAVAYSFLVLFLKSVVVQRNTRKWRDILMCHPPSIVFSLNM